MTAEESRKFSGGFTRRLAWLLLAGGLLTLVPLQRRIDGEMGLYGPIADILYMPSGNVLRRLALGNEGLLADIYWTRAVQYFGRRRVAHEARYDLLAPLLDVTTELDPQLLIAYRYGVIFLTEKKPAGADQPQEAIRLLRRGIVANPGYWRLWQDLGFVYYWSLRDYMAAARVFKAGSERPGAEVWMKVMAARVSHEGGDLGTSVLLWSEILRQPGNEDIRRSAEAHLAALTAQVQMNQLNRSLQAYRRQFGREARGFQSLVDAGMLPAFPRDPSGVPYAIAPDGKAQLGPRSGVNLRLAE